MPIVGEADVIITAVTTQLEQKIRTALDNMARDAEHGGGDAGDKWGQGFEDESNGHFKNVIEQMGMGLSAGGLHEGESYGHNVAQGISHGLGVADQDIDNIGRKLENVGQGAGDAIARDVERGIGDAETAAGSGGNDIGKAVADGVSSGASAIGDWASILKIGGLVAAIGLAAGAIANLVAGLFAIVSAAAPAAAALAAFLPIAGGLAFTLGTAAIGFLGVFKAVSALNKQQDSGGTSAKSYAQAQQAAADRVISAREAVQRAEESLANARQTAADDQVNAEHSVEQAELSLQAAQRNEQQAQQDLTLARQEAAAQLIQLQFQLRQSVISEQDAQLALTNAQQQYQQVISNPASSIAARQAASLAVQQAQLNLDEATQKTVDATKAQNQAQKEGIDGNDKVVAATQRVKDAHQSVIDAEYNLARLRHTNAEQAVKDQQAIQNAIQGVTDANRGLTEALQAQKDAANGVGGAANAASNALKNLSPQAVQFAKYLVSLKPLFLQVQGAASGMFLPLEDGIKSIVSGFFPTLIAGVSTTSTAIGNAFDFIAKHFVSTPLFNSQFKALIAANAGGLGALSEVVTNLLKAFTQLAVDAIPLAQRFTGWLVSITESFSNFVSAGSVGGTDSPIVKFFKLAGDRAALLGDIIKQIARIFFDWGKGADATGLDLLETFDKVAKKFADGLGSKEGQEKLHNFFAEVEPGFKALMSLIGAILTAFIDLAASPGLKTVADQLRTGLLPMLQHLIDYLNTNVVPKIVPILTDVGRVVMNIVNSGVLQTVVRDLGALVRAIADFASNPLVGVLIGHMGNLFAAFIAFKVFQKFSPFDEIAKNIGGLRSGFKELEVSADTAATAAFKFGLALKEMITSSDLSAMERLTTTVDVFRGRSEASAAGPLLKGQSQSDIKPAIEGVTRLSSEGTLLERAGSKISLVLGGIGEALAAITAPVAIAVAAIGILVGTFIYAYKTSETVRQNVTEILDGLKKAFLAFIDPILKVVEPAFVELANAIGIHGKDIGAVMHTLGEDVRKAWEVITGAIAAAMPTIQVIMGIIGTVIADTFKVAFAIIIPLIEISIDIIKTTFIVMADVIKGVIVAVRAVIVTTWTVIKNTIVPVVKAMWTVISAEFRIGYAILSGIIHVIYDILTGKWSDIGKDIKNTVEDIWGTIKSVFGKARDFLSTVFSGVAGFFKSAFGDVKDIITTPINALLSVLHGVLHAIGQIHFHVPSLDTHIPGIGKIGGFDFGVPDLSDKVPTHLAQGATILPTPGGTLAVLAEAGRAESVVDTGLLNARLASDDKYGQATVDELRSIRDALQRIQQFGGITIEQLIATSHEGEKVADTVPRSLRNLAFELGA